MDWPCSGSWCQRLLPAPIQSPEKCPCETRLRREARLKEGARPPSTAPVKLRSFRAPTPPDRISSTLARTASASFGQAVGTARIGARPQWTDTAATGSLRDFGHRPFRQRADLQVLVSADGGGSWAEAVLPQPVLSMPFTRFRVPWPLERRPGCLAKTGLGRG